MKNGLSGACVSANGFELKGSMKICCCSFVISGRVMIGEMKFEEIILLMQRKGSDPLIPWLRVSPSKSREQLLWNESLIADMQVECLKQLWRSIAQ